MLPGDLFEREHIHRDVIETRIEALGPVKSGIGIFCHEAIEEQYLRHPVLLDADLPEPNHAQIAHRRIALELAIGENGADLGRLEADARPRLDVAAKMPGRAGVGEDLPVRIDEQVGNDIGVAVGADGCEMRHRRSLQKPIGGLPAQHLVLAT